MLSMLQDTAAAWRIAAKTRRLLSERLLSMAESAPASDEDAGWRLLGGDRFDGPAAADERTLREDARRLSRTNPYARNALRLMESYVAGPDLVMTVRPVAGGDEAVAGRVAEVWRRFVEGAAGHWSFREHAARAWRDGEAFVRFFEGPGGVPQVRFVDPGRIDETPQHPGTRGVLTDRRDVETPRVYLQHAADGGVEEVPAAEMFHTRRGVDSNERRGRSLLAPCVGMLTSYDRWLETELKARKLQASIVLWRKVQGGPHSAEAKERVAPGTILTTSPGTELEFLQPKTNLADAVPLGRMMLLAVAAGTGLPEFMLTADASNANFASTMVAEGPAVKLFEAEQRWLAGELSRFFRHVLAASDLSASGLSAADVPRVRPEWTFPQLVSRDRCAERATDIALMEAGVLSRREVARREGVDPDAMDGEKVPKKVRDAAAENGR